MKGVKEGFCYALSWSTPRPAGTAAEATTGDVFVGVAGRPVWGRIVQGRVHGVHWTWIELLEHLASQWPALMWEESDPLGLGASLSSIRRRAEELWADRADDEAKDREQRVLLRFERSHDLAFALGGAAFPSVCLLREGADMRVGGGRRREVRRPLAEVKATLESLGDEIAARLATTKDERATLARRSWAARDGAPLETRVSFATGLAPAAIQAIEQGRDPSDVWGFVGELSRPTPQLAAARMIGRAPAAVVSGVLDWIHGLEPRDTPDLDGLSARAMASGGPGERRAFAEGYALATWLRSIPGIASSSDRVDPETLLGRFGVRVDDKDLGWPAIEAVACWGSRRGPAVLVNTGGTHAHTKNGRRSTLAHEVCHLLVDRDRSLPLAEVLGGRAPAEAEQRANAFAAELLLPRAAVAAALHSGGTAPQVVAALKRRFGVSGQIVAWQAIRSDAVITKATLALLRQLVPFKDRPNFDRAAGRS